ncbi:MAG: choice-of-anchor J domain-containing protein [Ferruginibacter sp.]
MRKSIVRNLTALSAALLIMLQACKDDSNLTEKTPVADQSFTETFDNYQEAYGKGWRSINKSTPSGRINYDMAEIPNMGVQNYVSIYYPDWDQAQFTVDSTLYQNVAFPQRYWETAYRSQRASNGYVATSFAACEIFEDHEVNAWLVSPETIIKNGDKIVFYTYSKGASRLQLWVNATNSTNVGDALDNTGDFTIKLVDINPNNFDFATNPIGAFPQQWTRFEGVVRGLQAPVHGCFGFRYYAFAPASAATNIQQYFNEIHNGIVGIDEVSYISAQ